MFPSNYEYLSLLIMFLLITILIFGSYTNYFFISREYLPSYITFFVLCFLIDYYAIGEGWWFFNQHKIVGLRIFTIPLEEYILFHIFYIFTISAWKAFNR